MSNLVTHAEYELRRAGIFDKDADYNGALSKVVMDLIRLFASQKHSGYSANMTLDLFNELARFRPLTPITSDPEEWTDVSHMSDSKMWQNKRRTTSFSRDGGQTWYDIDDASLNNGDSWFSDEETREFLLDFGIDPDKNFIVLDTHSKSRIFDELYQLQKRYFGDKQEVGKIVIDRDLNRRLRSEI